jgi:hypothetical protein
LTRSRITSGEPAFGSWLRGNPRLDAQSKGIYITDVDYSVFHFKTGKLFFLEVKTRGADVGPYQGEVLGILDEVCRRVTGGTFETRRGKRRLAFQGVYRLILHRTSPDDSDWMLFGKVDGPVFRITTNELEQILSPEAPMTPENWIALQKLGEIQDQAEAA